MEERSIKNLETVCRTCLVESDIMVFMFDSSTKFKNSTLPEMLMSCTQLEINQDDGLPGKMCPKCIHHVEEAYSFRMQAERCNRILKDILASRDNFAGQLNVKQEFNDDYEGYNNTLTNEQYFDDSEDGVPLSSVKNNHLLIYNCKFCEFCNVSENVILNHLVGIHREDCGLDGFKSRGRPSQQEINDRKRKIKPLLGNYVTTSDYDSKLFFNAVNVGEQYLDSEESTRIPSELIESKKKSAKRKRNETLMCDMCGRSFAQLGQLQKHKLKCHKDGNLQNKRNVKKEKTFVCSKCNKAFYREEQLERHVKTHLPREKIYQCPDCPKKYARSDKLKFHSRVHVTNKDELVSNFLCVYCGHGFSNSSNLIVHLRRHTGEKPYKCDICQKGFPRSTDLLNHRIIHTGEKPCVCKVCGKAFSRQHKLVRHERIHTGHKPFKCTMCDRAFTQSNDLTLHIRRHTGDKPYVCTVCGDRFYLNTVLQAHKRTHGHYDSKEQAMQAEFSQKHKLQELHNSVT